MAQRQPVVSPDMPIVWGKDATTVYVADEEGVWRATLGEPFMALWEMVHAVSDIRALAISPSRSWLVVEAGAEEERALQELHLTDNGIEVGAMRGGWGVKFTNGEDLYFYGDYSGFYAVV